MMAFIRHYGRLCITLLELSVIIEAVLGITNGDCASSTTLNKTMVRAGNDYKCLTQSNGIAGCIEACCGDPRCLSFSWNQPWGLPDPYMGGCVQGKDCCCLKDQVPPLEKSKWNFTIISGVRPPPPPPRCETVTDCSLNGICNTSSGNCICDPGWKVSYMPS